MNQKTKISQSEKRKIILKVVKQDPLLIASVSLASGLKFHNDKPKQKTWTQIR